MSEKVIDSQTPGGYCLQCSVKHSSAALILMQEILERENFDANDPLIREKLIFVMGNLAEIERHTADPNITNPDEKSYVTKLNKDARIIRNNFREYMATGNKSFFDQAATKLPQLTDEIAIGYQRFSKPLKTGGFTSLSPPSPPPSSTPFTPPKLKPKPPKFNDPLDLGDVLPPPPHKLVKNFLFGDDE